MRRYSFPLVPETFQARFPVSSVVCRRSVDLWPTPKYHAAREKKTPGTQGSVRKRVEDTCHMIRFIYGKLESSICTI